MATTSSSIIPVTQGGGLDTGPKPQVRAPGAHDANQGNPLRIVCFPKSNDIDIKQSFPKPRRIANPIVPTTATLPPTPSPIKELTEHQHLAYKGKTAYPMPRGRRGLGNKTTADTVLSSQTKITGKCNKNTWKTPKITKKTKAKRAKAAKWMVQFG